MDKEEIIKQSVKIIREHLDETYKIFLFGSWANGDAQETSDLDIGILGKEKVPWSVMTAVRRKIDSIPTLRKVDIVDFMTTDKSFRENALKTAKYLN